MRGGEGEGAGEATTDIHGGREIYIRRGRNTRVLREKPRGASSLIFRANFLLPHPSLPRPPPRAGERASLAALAPRRDANVRAVFFLKSFSHGRQDGS